MNNIKKQIIFSFDYELFLGANSGTVNDCLIEPTNRILKILNSNNTTAVFFIDSSYLVRLEEISKTNKNAAEDFKNIQAQICNIVDSGHYAYLHLHPHWNNAIYNSTSNVWNLIDKSQFGFQCMNAMERTIMFNNSYDLLNKIVGKSKLKTSILGFRAGGLYIQPFLFFSNLFEKKKIIYDFSVLPDFSSNMNKFNFDFTPYKSKKYYKFSHDVLIPDNEGKFIEFSLSTFELKNINKIINGIEYRILKLLNKFKPIEEIHSSGNRLSSIKKNYLNSKETLSIELLNNYKMKLIINLLNETDYLHFISHTKLVSVYNLNIFNKFLKKINEKYDIESNHMNFVV